MTIQRKVLLGLVSVVPLLIFAAIIGPMIYFSFNDPATLGRFLLERSTIELTVFNAVLLVGNYGPVILYLYYVAQNAALKERRLAWLLAVAIAGQFALPVYWFLFIWKAQSSTTRV